MARPPAPGWLPKYAPELNGIERDWKTLKAIVSPTNLQEQG
jgi:transposase